MNELLILILFVFVALFICAFIFMNEEIKELEQVVDSLENDFILLSIEKKGFENDKNISEQ